MLLIVFHAACAAPNAQRRQRVAGITMMAVGGATVAGGTIAIAGCAGGWNCYNPPGSNRTGQALLGGAVALGLILVGIGAWLYVRGSHPPAR